MDQGPTTHKFVALMNKKVEPGRIMNAIGHLTAGLVNRATEEQRQAMRFQDYIDANGGVHPSISDDPFIILKADNSNKIRTVRNTCIQQGIPFTDFTHTMVEGTYLDQQNRTKETLEEQLEYFGIVLFGPIEVIRELTGKFSLWT
ncbi:MAG: DUF2000 domain-containing protein [bacterium]|nr:DUF2000 domain-containing protein [bacterium]